jgi:hypothetical protein
VGVMMSSILGQLNHTNNKEDSTLQTVKVCRSQWVTGDRKRPEAQVPSEALSISLDIYWAVCTNKDLVHQVCSSQVLPTS